MPVTSSWPSAPRPRPSSRPTRLTKSRITGLVLLCISLVLVVLALVVVALR